MSDKILVIEDEGAIADTIYYALKTEGFETQWSQTGSEGLNAFSTYCPDLIILDIGLPDINGYELCKEIRRNVNVPVIFLTARNSEIDRVVGLEIGADDYVTKPFSPRELTARVKAVLRRCSVPKNPPVSTMSDTPENAMFKIEMLSRIIYFQGKSLDLSKNEYNLLVCLIKNPGRVFSRDELMGYLTEDSGFILDRTVDAHIKNIRSKLRTVNPHIEPIETRRGFGYCLKSL
jgi:two-component system, OmpR family, catabolic regulation response regulator CreB